MPTRVIADIHGDPAAPAQALRIADAEAARPARRRARALRAAAQRRRADDLGVHVGTRSRGRRRADRRVRGLHGSRAVRRVGARAAARAAGRAVRRRARALQGRRRARGGLAARGAARPGGDAAPRRPRRRCARSAAALVRDLPAQTRWTESLSTPEVARALDEATVLVLPSRSEGLGRVVVEAFCRGRGVVGSRVGGIPDLVEDGVTGLLVAPGDAHALADALVRVLVRPRRSPSGSERRRTAPSSRGSRRRRSTPVASASSSTKCTTLGPPTLTRCGRTGRSSS